MRNYNSQNSRMTYIPMEIVSAYSIWGYRFFGFLPMRISLCYSNQIIPRFACTVSVALCCANWLFLQDYLSLKYFSYAIQ